MLQLSACGIVNGNGYKSKVSDAGLCDGLEKPVDDLNDALLKDGGPQSIVAGDAVIAGYDAGCLNG